MQTSKTRLMAISGATLALVIASTAAVAAHPGDQREQRGFGKANQGQLERGKAMFGQRGDMRGALRGAMRDRVDQFVRTETTYEAEDGLVTRRVDNGTVQSAGDAALDYSLSTGESASVAIDEDTSVIAFSEQTVEVGRRGFSRERMVPEEIVLADIESGAEIVVWAESQDDGTFLAQRIVVQPAADDDAAEVPDEAGAVDAGASDDSAIAPVTDA
jgi:hypothetical protein